MRAKYNLMKSRNVFEVYRYICILEPVSVKQLEKVTGKSGSNLTQQIKCLKENKFVVGKKHGRDKDFFITSKKVDKMALLLSPNFERYLKIKEE